MVQRIIAHPYKLVASPYPVRSHGTHSPNQGPRVCEPWRFLTHPTKGCVHGTPRYFQYTLLRCVSVCDSVSIFLPLQFLQAPTPQNGWWPLPEKEYRPAIHRVEVTRKQNSSPYRTCTLSERRKHENSDIADLKWLNTLFQLFGQELFLLKNGRTRFKWWPMNGSIITTRKVT